MPGETISALTPVPGRGPVRSASAMPSAAAFARAAAPSSQATTSAPPAASAATVGSPDRPSPSTATLCPA